MEPESVEHSLDSITTDLDRALQQIVNEATVLCRPQLHIFVLNYVPHGKWVCRIQESRHTATCIGTGGLPRNAVAQAMIALYKRNEAERPYDKPVFKAEDMERMLKLAYPDPPTSGND